MPDIKRTLTPLGSTKSNEAQVVAVFLRIIYMVSFLSLFRKYIHYYESAVDKFEKRKPATIKAYFVYYHLINEFLFEHSIINIPAEEFDVDVSKELGKWMANKKLEDGSFIYAHNYIVRTRQICTSVLTFGLSNKIIKKHPLYFLKLKKTPPEKPPYLTASQIEALHKYRPLTIRNFKAKQMAIIQIHTAFDYGDFGTLNRRHKIFFKERPFLVKPRHKNGNEQIIPITPELDFLLEEHDYKVQLLSSQKYNLALKDIQLYLGWNLPNIDTKMMRKIALGNKLNNEGWPLEVTSKFAGHNSITTTQTYYAQPNINLVYNQISK